MTGTYRIAASGSEQVTPDVYADSDPTGVTLEFAITQGPGDTPQPTTWTTGTWGTWDADAGKASTLSPLIGSATAPKPASLIATAGLWRLWLRITTASESPVLAGPIIEMY